MATNPDTAIITQVIINLAKSLKLKVISEDVEACDQWELLRAQGCDEIQGYYVSKPLPADEFGDLFREALRSEAAYALTMRSRRR